MQAPTRQGWLVTIAPPLTAALLTAGCGGGAGGLETKSVTGYEPSNMITKTGYHVESLGGDRYRVVATGSQYTPQARLEKIALARAAEYGVEQRKKYFQATAPQASIQCGQRDYIERGKRKTMAATGYRAVAIDVTYTQNGDDPAVRSARDAMKNLKAELQSEVVAEDAKDAIAADIKAQCGT